MYATISSVSPLNQSLKAADIVGVQFLGIVASNEMVPFALSPLSPELTADVYWGALVRHKLMSKSSIGKC